MTPGEVRRLAAKFAPAVPTGPELLQKSRELRRTAMAYLREYRRNEGLCIHCGKPRSKAPGRTTCDRCVTRH